MAHEQNIQLYPVITAKQLRKKTLLKEMITLN